MMLILGLVYDVLGTQNCNYDYNVKTCGINRGGKKFCYVLIFTLSDSQFLIIRDILIQKIWMS